MAAEIHLLHVDLYNFQTGLREIRLLNHVYSSPDSKEKKVNIAVDNLKSLLLPLSCCEMENDRMILLCDFQQIYVRTKRTIFIHNL